MMRRMLCVGYISEYFHVRPDSHTPVASTRGLPPAHELLWQGKTVKLGGRTIYGQVWAGVRAWSNCYIFKCTQL